MRRLVLYAALSFTVASAGARATPAESSCVSCHGQLVLSRTLVEQFEPDVHAEAGLSCHDCHGGNPSAGLSGTTFAAMHVDRKEHPFLGTPAKPEIPSMCGRCHNDLEYMSQFASDPRIGQETLYRSSHHGRALDRGDPNTAECVDCHRAHGTRRVNDGDSLVFPTRVAETCGACHSGRERKAEDPMNGGGTFAADPVVQWKASVHGRALLEKGDMASPTCNDCHGNHGSIPANLESVEDACTACHIRESQLVQKSPLMEGFKQHRVYMEGKTSCVPCHEPPDPVGSMASDTLDTECVVCHGSHWVPTPTIAMLDPSPELVCEFCHRGLDEDAPSEARTLTNRRRLVVAARDGLLAEARTLSIVGSELFDWLLERSNALTAHRPNAEPGEVVPYEELLIRLRIGPVQHTLGAQEEASAGRAKIVRCSDCHSPENLIPGLKGPLTTAWNIRSDLVGLTSRSGQAGAMLVSAKRAGVYAPLANGSLEAALRARSELGVQLHQFLDGEDEGAFLETHSAGVKQAEAALESAGIALVEVTRRRRWLSFSLAMIGSLFCATLLAIRRLNVAAEVPDGERKEKDETENH